MDFPSRRVACHFALVIIFRIKNGARIHREQRIVMFRKGLFLEGNSLRFCLLLSLSRQNAVAFPRVVFDSNTCIREREPKLPLGFIEHRPLYRNLLVHELEFSVYLLWSFWFRRFFWFCNFLLSLLLFV